MKYQFIPSWYTREGLWYTGERPWFEPAEQYEFDDTINQLSIFQGAGEDAGLLLLSYTPGLRRLLNRENLLRIPVVSLFDRMQGIHRTMPGMLLYRSLPWPEDTEFLITPYCAYAQRTFGSRKETFARVDFGEDGNFIYITWLNDDEPFARDIYDDRGFLSSRIYYTKKRKVINIQKDRKKDLEKSENHADIKDQNASDNISLKRGLEKVPKNGDQDLSIVTKIDYFDEAGQLQFTENRLDGTVSISGQAVYPYKKAYYHGFGEMLSEVLFDYFHVPENANASIVLASDPQHNPIVLSTLAEQKLVLSLAGGRFSNNINLLSIEQDAGRAVMIVTDTEHLAKLLRKDTAISVPIYDITPFDTRLELGKSPQIRALKILMPVDGFSGIYLEKALKQVLQYMKKNPAVELHMLIRGDDARAEEASEMLEGVCHAAGFPDVSIGMEGEKKRIGLPVFLDTYLSETDLLRLLEDIRVILDLRDQPNLYLQIAGISTGIPEINYRFTQYVDHQKNGYIVENIDHVTEALEYYLSELSHWNEALVYCMDKIQLYRGGTLVEKWKALTEGK